MDLSNLCRLCASVQANFVRIYEVEGQNLNLATKIIQCLQIWLYPEDPLPKAVCVDCCGKLNQYFDFFETSSKAQVSLQVMFDPKLVAKRELKKEEQEAASAVEIRDSEAVEDEDDDDDDDADAAEMPVELDESEISDEEADQVAIPMEILCSLDNTLPSNAREAGPSATASSRRKCRVPVKRTQPPITRLSRVTRVPLKERIKIKIKKEPALVKERTPTVRIAKMRAGQKFKEVKEKEKEKDKDDRKRPGRKKKEIAKPEVVPKGKPKAVLEGYPWVCTDCEETLPTLPALRLHHQNVHDQIPNFKCIQCFKTYTRYRSFARHVKLHRNPKKFKCDECGKCFSQKTVLQSHSTVHTDARPHVCPQCGKAFKQFSSLYLHSKCHLPDQVKPKFPCNICNKDFATKHTLETHRKIHTGERNFICDVCGKSFIAKGSLDYHILTHSGDKPHACPVCGKGFKTQRLLGKHATLHTGIKPHQCDVCGKQFRERGALREHNRIHTGAMPYSCEFCGKNFRFKGILTVHRRQHTGERPYGCVDCRREFTNWANFNKHMKRRHQIDESGRPYRPHPTHTGGTPARGSIPPKIVGPNALLQTQQTQTQPQPPPPPQSQPQSQPQPQVQQVVQLQQVVQVQQVQPQTLQQTLQSPQSPETILPDMQATILNNAVVVNNGAIYQLTHNDNSNSSSVSNINIPVNHNVQVYQQNQHIGQLATVTKMTPIYTQNNVKQMNVFHDGKMATITNVFHHQDVQDDRSHIGNTNTLMGTYHVPTYVAGGLPMGSMGYYIPPIHHSDPNMEMLQHRMSNNQ